MRQKCDTVPHRTKVWLFKMLICYDEINFVNQFFSWYINQSLYLPFCQSSSSIQIFCYVKGFLFSYWVLLPSVSPNFVNFAGKFWHMQYRSQKYSFLKLFKSKGGFAKCNQRANHKPFGKV